MVTKINDGMGGDYFASVKEAEMRSSTDSVNENNDFWYGFDASTCAGKTFMNFLIIRAVLFLRIQLFESILIKKGV